VIVVRDEEPRDFALVYEVQCAAFARSSEAELVAALRAAAAPRLSLVAELGGRVAGHVFFSPVSIDSPLRTPPVAGLAPLGVAPQQQGRGVGGALVRAGLSRCAALGFRAVFLVGSPRYYARFGFALAAPRGFRYRSERFDPVLQLCELEPGALEGCSGEIHYHPAFAATGTA
jgi:putative acetyltransferase